MSYTSGSIRVETISDLVGAMTGWIHTYRLKAALYAIGGGIAAIIVHVIGAGRMPPWLARSFCFLDFGTPASVGTAVMYWLLLAVIVCGVISYFNTSRHASFVNALTSAPRCWANLFRASGTRTFRGLSLGIALGFLYLAIFQQGGLMTGALGYNAVSSGVPEEPVTVLLIAGLLIASLSPLCRFAAGSLVPKRDALSLAAMAAAAGVFCLSCTLPLLATLPIGAIAGTTRIGLLLVLTAFLVWKFGSRVHPGARPLLVVALLVAVSASSLRAEDVIAEGWSPSQWTTREQWVNAWLASIVGFVGAGLGAALGSALGMAEAASTPSPTPASAPAVPVGR